MIWHNIKVVRDIVILLMISGGGDGIGGKSWLSWLLARGPPPGGKEEKDNGSTPVAFDVDDSNGGKVEVNGECKGNGNSNGPVDNNDDNYDAGNNDDDDNNGGGGRTEVQTWDVCECLTAGCKAFSLANVKGTGTNDWVIKSLDD